MDNVKMYRQDPLISCFVPSCKNTALMSPNKYFFFIPHQNRVEWCAAVDKPNVPKGSLYICEDHINPEEDLLNYQNWKDGHARARLKPRVPFLKNILKANMQSSQSEVADLASSSTCQPQAQTQSKGILCIPEYCNKSIQVKSVTMDKCVSSSFKPILMNEAEDHIVDIVKEENEIEEPSDENVPIIAATSSTTEFSETDCSADMKSENVLTGRQFLLMLIQKNPENYIGIPKKGYWIVEYLETNCKVSSLHVIITFYKIKNNDTFSRISDLFQISETTLWRMFYKTLNVLKCFLNQLVYWPSVLYIKINLPLSFRVNSVYANVQCIIDCFEIQIEKPKNPVYQSLTWSQYKDCNTMKYLIGATPDGFTNFISEGYGGRTSDVNIVKNSGFLNVIPTNCTILADRGFKHLETQRIRKSSKLLRPPSVSKDIKMTKSEVINSKVIASLRVHIERVIRRLRLYKVLKPHSVVNNKLILINLDDAVIVACGLINLQTPLLKNV